MSDKTDSPATDAATRTTPQPTEPVATEDTAMPEPKQTATEPQTASVETRSQPKPQKPDITPAPDPDAAATRAREAERDRVSTIYDLAGRLNPRAQLCRGSGETAARISTRPGARSSIRWPPSRGNPRL
ncbi:hypothetical protein ACFQBU_00005, partial [Jhaorihella thermophila]